MELTTENENGEEVTHTILSLTVGGVEQVSVTLLTSRHWLSISQVLG